MKNSRAIRILVRVFLFAGLALCAAAVAMAVIRSDIADITVPWILMIVFACVGVPFLLVGLILQLTIKNEEKRENLKYTGEAFQAKVIDAERNLNMTVNGRTPYRLLCSCEENGTVYLYRSENIWYDPMPLLKGDTVTIYRDRSNPRKYYVDIGEVLPPTEEV